MIPEVAAVWNTYAQELSQALAAGNATEHTHRPALKQLLDKLRSDVCAVNEPKRVACGAPDYAITRGGRTVGYIEAKDVGVNLDEVARSEQMQRYRGALPNLLLTDYLEFRWYVGGTLRESARFGTWEAGRLQRAKSAALPVADLVTGFLDHAPLAINTPAELAQHLARLAHLIRDVVLQAVRSGAVSDDLRSLRDAMAATLLPELSEPEQAGDFADMYAQTLAYGLFAARCHHRGTGSSFRRVGAAAEIPKTNPFLRRLFESVTGTALDDEPHAGFVDDLVQLLADADIDLVLAEFGKRTRQDDPVVHFYETFLQAYDPRLRELRGVYYTPAPVVSYIVRSVDHLLKTRFGLPQGLADRATTTVEVTTTGPDGQPRVQQQTHPRVLILDPACGTGTFLYAVVDHIRETFRQTNNAGLWSSYVKQHLLPRLYGFELLMAPYTVAHLKLGLQLAGRDLPAAERAAWAYDFAGDERLNILLTNTLAETARQERGFGVLATLTAEANAAQAVKEQLPIMVVLGNPPYANFGRQNRNPWILGLLDDYKRDLKERKINLDDDFIKFIRWAQHRIDRTGRGIVAMITNHVYLDGLTHRRMRQSLRETFDDIYVLDLHGNSRRREVAPDGGVDENVFDIQQGVAICLLVKYGTEAT